METGEKPATRKRKTLGWRGIIGIYLMIGGSLVEIMTPSRSALHDNALLLSVMGILVNMSDTPYFAGALLLFGGEVAVRIQHIHRPVGLVYFLPAALSWAFAYAKHRRAR